VRVGTRRGAKENGMSKRERYKRRRKREVEEE
jgi:hypothetical protein